MSEAARSKATVYVGGLDHAVTAEILHGAFIPFGDIADISLPKPDLPSATDPHRGFGYVEFETAEDAKEAIDNMDQSELFGRVIKVTQAKPKKDANTKLGSKTAIWQQVSHRNEQHPVQSVSDNPQEGYLSKYAGEEPTNGNGAEAADNDAPYDPMQGLEGLDVAGPRQS